VVESAPVEEVVEVVEVIEEPVSPNVWVLYATYGYKNNVADIKN